MPSMTTLRVSLHRTLGEPRSSAREAIQPISPCAPDASQALRRSAASGIASGRVKPQASKPSSSALARISSRSASARLVSREPPWAPTPESLKAFDRQFSGAAIVHVKEISLAWPHHDRIVDEEKQLAALAGLDHRRNAQSIFRRRGVVLKGGSQGVADRIFDRLFFLFDCIGERRSLGALIRIDEGRGGNRGLERIFVIFGHSHARDGRKPVRAPPAPKRRREPENPVPAAGETDRVRPIALVEPVARRLQGEAVFAAF